MKKIFLFAILMKSAVASFCQYSNQPNQPLQFAEPNSQPQRKSLIIESFPDNRQMLLTKSRHYKAAGHAFVWTGAGLLTVGTLVSIYTSGWGANPFPPEVIPFYAGGLACMAASIPLFHASNKNFREANELSASLKLESKQQLKDGATSIVRYPALSIRVKF